MARALRSIGFGQFRTVETDRYVLQRQDESGAWHDVPLDRALARLDRSFPDIPVFERPVPKELEPYRPGEVLPADEDFLIERFRRIATTLEDDGV